MRIFLYFFELTFFLFWGKIERIKSFFFSRCYIFSSLFFFYVHFFSFFFSMNQHFFFFFSSFFQESVNIFQCFWLFSRHLTVGEGENHSKYQFCHLKWAFHVRIRVNYARSRVFYYWGLGIISYLEKSLILSYLYGPKWVVSSGIYLKIREHWENIGFIEPTSHQIWGPYIRAAGFFIIGA